MKHQHIILGIFFLFFFSSCATYKQGYIKNPERFYDKNTPSLNKEDLLAKKWELTQKSEALVKSIEAVQQTKAPITPLQLNTLFDILNSHFRYDSIYHLNYLKAENPEEKHFWKQQMIQSAKEYNRLFQHNKTLRRIIDRGDGSYGVSKKQLRHSQQFLVEQANSNDSLKQLQLVKEIKSELLADQGHSLVHNTVGFLSMVVGVFISNIHLEPQPLKNIPRLMPHLEPYDIILQKSRNRLTDKIIPGYFGHTAIYMGDSLFAEALHEGVVLNGPFRFCEGDSYLVIRAKNLTEQQKAHIKDMVQRQMGKSYDYQYDAELTYQITCSELAYIAFDFIPWQTSKLFGRHTFSPDDVAATVLNCDQLEFVVYFDKKRTVVKPSNEFIKGLLDE
jgi:uncharacterized protein YycO